MATALGNYIAIGKFTYNALLFYTLFCVVSEAVRSCDVYRITLLVGGILLAVRYYMKGLVVLLTLGHFIYSIFKFVFAPKPPPSAQRPEKKEVE